MRAGLARTDELGDVGTAFDEMAERIRELLLSEKEDDLPRIFEPFFRGERSRSRGTGGVGLGLTLTRRIVEAHAGAIEVSSRPGAGTLARIVIPLRDAAGA